MDNLEENIREDYVQIYVQGIPTLSRRGIHSEPDLKRSLYSNPRQFARAALDFLKHHPYSKNRIEKLVDENPNLSRGQKRKVKSRYISDELGYVKPLIDIIIESGEGVLNSEDFFELFKEAFVEGKLDQYEKEAAEKRRRIEERNIKIEEAFDSEKRKDTLKDIHRKRKNI